MIKQFLLAFLLSFLMTPLVRTLAVMIGAVDIPNERKVHRAAIPRLGGVAIVGAFFFTVYFLYGFSHKLFGFVLASIPLVTVGIIDDIRGVNAWAKLAVQILSVAILIFFGMEVSFVGNPLGGIVNLSTLSVLGVSFAQLAAMAWLLLVINAVNFLDGLDGLSSGVSGIAALILFALSLSEKVSQPETASLALILAGAALGFLALNFYPARIFMGDTGSTFLGLALGMLAIISGAKIATAALVLGLPIIDLFWAILRRLKNRSSLFKPDKEHFHHLLIAMGMTQRQAVIFIYTLTAVFGSVALFGETNRKLLAFFILFVMVFVIILIGRNGAKAQREQAHEKV